MKLTETMSVEDVTTLRILFAKYNNDLKYMDADERMHTRDGIFASNSYNTIFWFMLTVRDSNNKSDVVWYVLNNLNRAWNEREEWSNRHMATGNETYFTRFDACAVQVITLKRLLHYIIS